MEINAFVLVLVIILGFGVLLANNIVYRLLNKQIHKQGEKIMATVKELQTKIDELTAAEQAREQRDRDQDAVTQQQVALLTQTIADLQAQIANGVTIPDTVIASIQATIDSLNAADPTPPVVPTP